MINCTVNECKWFPSAFKRLRPYAQYIHLARMHFANFIALLFFLDHVLQLECSIKHLKPMQGFLTSVGTLYNLEPKKIRDWCSLIGFKRLNMLPVSVCLIPLSITLKPQHSILPPDLFIWKWLQSWDVYGENFFIYCLHVFKSDSKFNNEYWSLLSEIRLDPWILLSLNTVNVNIVFWVRKTSCRDHLKLKKVCNYLKCRILSTHAP